MSSYLHKPQVNDSLCYVLEQRMLVRRREQIYLHAPSHRRQSRGFTLLELLITITVIAMLVGVGVSSFSQVSNVQLRVQSNRLASSLKQSFGYAVSHGKYMRMVLNLDTHEFWVESSSEPIFISQDKRAEGVDPNELTELELRENEKATRDGRPTIKRATYNKQEVVQSYKFEKGVKLKGVFTPNQEELFTSDKAYIHFFPHGFAEPALIHLAYEQEGAEETGNSYTLLLKPLTGHVERRAGTIEPDQYFGKPFQEEEED